MNTALPTTRQRQAHARRGAENVASQRGAADQH